MEKQQQICIYTDGGSRGNPGPSAIGVYAADALGMHLYSHGEPLGVTTNNVAEYQAVIHALKWVLTHHIQTDHTMYHFFLDSELVCRQIAGVYKVKNETLRSFVQTIWELQRQLPFPITFTHVPRAKNKQADELVNMALDRNATVSYNKE